MRTLALLSLAFLAGCSSPKPCGMLTVRPLPSGEVSTEPTRMAEVVHAYQVGRYVDPSQGSILHEQHAVYRIEAGPRWNLRAPPEGCPPAVAMEAPKDPTVSPVPIADELRAELRHQQDVTGIVAYKATELTRAFEELQAALKATHVAAQGQVFLSGQMSELEHQVQALQEQMRNSLQGAQAVSKPDQNRVEAPTPTTLSQP